MSTSGIARASLTERALERLEAAVQRLDDALANGGGIEAQPASGDADALKSENESLKALNREAAEALGGAIAELETIAQSAREG